MKIFKYELPVFVDSDGSARFGRRPFEIEMPKHARVLSVGAQGGRGMLWALVDPTAPPERRRFEIVPTGVDFDTEYEPVPSVYIPRGAVLLNDGAFVFHVFEVVK